MTIQAAARLARAPRVSIPDRALQAAAGLWFLVAAAGQWTFVYYTASFYWRPTLQGHFEAWNRKDVITGFVPADHVGNLYFAAHVMIAAFITASGVLQLFPQIRARAPSFHRWNGRFYILTAVLMALGGLWLVLVRGTYLTLYGAVSSTVLALLILGCAGMTLRLAMARRIEAHHRWALRTYLVVNGVWFQRIGYMGWILINRAPVGIGKRMDGWFDIFIGFAEFVIPLAVLEVYLRVKAGGGGGAKWSMSVVLVVCTAFTALGIVGAFLLNWKPYL